MTEQNGSFAWGGRSVLVTGVGGFVGAGLAHELLGRGAQVIGIIRDSGGIRLLHAVGIGDSVELVHGSITDPGLVLRAANEYEVDTIFHLAAQAIVGVANRSPVSTFESNIAGTWHVLEAARLSRTVQRVVVASSDKAYGDQPILPYKEDTPLHGLYPYDASKVCTDVLAQSYAAAFGLPVGIARCANIYGPGDLNWSRLIPGTIRWVLLGADPIIRSDGTPERDYIFLRDAVDAYLRLAENATQYPGQAFNFGTARSISALALVRQIVALSGNPRLQPRVLGQASGEIDRQCLAANKARTLLGWKPSVALAEGLRLSVDWYSQYLGALRPRMLEEVTA